MVWNCQGNNEMYDISFMVSRKCDLQCPFCMYACGPAGEDIEEKLDLMKAQEFIKTIDMSKVNSFGFYGGEPTLFLQEYRWLSRHLPADKPRFMISNGAWSTQCAYTTYVQRVARESNFKVWISSTPEHKKHQNLAVIADLCEHLPGYFEVKEAETSFLPMGRLSHLPVTCTRKCDTYTKPTRFAVCPDGGVIFQSCDGQYPEVGHMEEGFPRLHERIEDLRWNGFHPACPHY